MKPLYTLTDKDRQSIKELRERTYLPLLKCRNAIMEAEGDIEKAYKLLREQNPIRWGVMDGNRTF